MPPSADVVRQQVQREQVLRGIREWSLSGRIAVSNGKQGGSGRIDWHQQGDRYDISLAAPVTRQSWRLTGGPEGARIDGLDGGPRNGADAEALLREATGWEIPVAALADWVRGIGLPAEALRYGADGLPASARQRQWELGFSRWQSTTWQQAGIVMPMRLEAARGEAHVRLAIDEWQLEASATP